MSKSSPFAHYADEAEESASDALKPITLIKSKTPITVQQMIDALQKAIEKDPSLATKLVLTEQQHTIETSYKITILSSGILIDPSY